MKTESIYTLDYVGETKTGNDLAFGTVVSETWKGRGDSRRVVRVREPFVAFGLVAGLLATGVDGMTTRSPMGARVGRIRNVSWQDGKGERDILSDCEVKYPLGNCPSQAPDGWIYPELMSLIEWDQA